MWSPQKSSNGSRNQFYENMTIVSPGDIVFSFKATRIQAMGIIKSWGYESPKPSEFGEIGDSWSSVGWKVNVTYNDLSNKIRPKDFIDQLRPALPPKYSPLQSNGNGNQGVYLAEVPEELAEVLLQLIGLEAQEVVKKSTAEALSLEELSEKENDEIARTILENSEIEETEKLAIIRSRRGQGKFRNRVSRIETFCRVTKVSNPNHLVASHIKPWSKCENNVERLDGNNGLFLSPNVDHLFDKGFISFDDDGSLLIADKADRFALQQLGIDVVNLVNTGEFNHEQQAYLRFHRENIFDR